MTRQGRRQPILQNYNAGVVLPGGHAPVAELMQNDEVGVILHHVHEAGKTMALLCHGPVALAAAMPRAAEYRAALVAGETEKASALAKVWPYGGYRATVFSVSEEKWAEENLFHAKLPFYIPDILQLAGVEVSSNPTDWAPNVVVDRELITGQNMAPDHPLATTLIEALDRSLAVR